MKPRQFRCSKLYILLGVLAFGLITIALVMQQMHFRHANVPDAAPVFKLSNNLRSVDVASEDIRDKIESHNIVHDSPMKNVTDGNEALPSIDMLMQAAQLLNRSNDSVDDANSPPALLHNEPPIIDPAVEKLRDIAEPAQDVLPVPVLHSDAPTLQPSTIATTVLSLDIIPTHQLLLHSLYLFPHQFSAADGSVSPLSQLHRGLRHGTLQPATSSFLADTIASLLATHKTRLVFDLSSSCVTCSLISSYPATSFISAHSASTIAATPSNLFVSSSHALLQFKPASSLDCMQIITSYDSIIAEKLPFEVEESVGKMLSRCRFTLVPKSLPSSSFYSFWDDVEMLMLEAVSSLDSPLHIRFNATQSTRMKSINVDAYTLIENMNATANIDQLTLRDLFALDLSPTRLPGLFATFPQNANTTSDRHCVSGGLVGLCAHASSRDAHAIDTTHNTNKISPLSTRSSSSNRFSWMNRANSVRQGYDVADKEALVTTQPVTENVTVPFVEANNNTTANRKRRKLGAYVSPAVVPSSTAATLIETRKSHWDLSATDHDWIQLQAVETPAEEGVNKRFISRSTLGADDRDLLKLLKLREHKDYEFWSSTLLDTGLIIPKKCLFVGSHVTLLSVKLAQRFSMPTKNQLPLVVSIVTDGLAIPHHIALLDRMKITNNILLSSDINTSFPLTLLSSQDNYDIAVYQQDVVLSILLVSIEAAPMLQSAQEKNLCETILQLFEEQLAVLISAARTTFVDMPPIAVFVQFLEKVLDDSSCTDTIRRAYFSHRSVFEATSVRFGVRTSDSLHRQCVDLHGLAVECFGITVQEVPSQHRHVFRIESDLYSSVSSPMLSLYSVLHFQAVPQVKRQIARLFIDFPSFVTENDNQMPWDLYVSVSKHGNSTPAFGLHDMSDGTRVGVASGAANVEMENENAKMLYQILVDELDAYPADTTNGRFSIVEHGSGMGYLSLRLAHRYPDATVLSLERDSSYVHHHVHQRSQYAINNNAVCRKPAETSDVAMVQLLYESPELFRYQLAMHHIFDGFIQSDTIEQWGSQLGSLLSIALTTFISVPSAQRVSLAMMLFFSDITTLRRPLHEVYSHIQAPRYTMASPFDIANHPTEQYQGFETMFLMSAAKVRSGSTQVRFSPMFYHQRRVPIVRCDILNMTRNVHHHYDYAKDGHSRTYTMRVEVNTSLTDTITSSVGRVSSAVIQSKDEHMMLSAGDVSVSLPLGVHTNHNSLVSVTLHRDKDDFPIPYTSIYGITLISVLRMGLEASIRDLMFSSFLSLPLYEDMAPWNIVLNGKDLAYIDFDTRDVMFDADVPKAYQVMSVLMNYKRTVEDFKRCGPKASTVYGFGFVSDCVGTFQKNGPTCSNLKYPVPCGDGTCHSDYISCLKSLAQLADKVAVVPGNDINQDPLAEAVAQAMRSGIASFDDKGPVLRRLRTSSV